MSRSKLFNMVKARGENKQGRNPFDLTNKHVYSQKVAKIVPVKAIGTYPDDYFEINVSEFTQNKVPMNRAAFLTGKKELLAYFVPYNSIWHNFNQYMATREDPDSTLLYDKGISFEPRMRIYDLYYTAFWFASGYFALEGFRQWDVLYYFLNNGNSSSLFPLFYPDGYTTANDVRGLAQVMLNGSLDPSVLLQWMRTTTIGDLYRNNSAQDVSIFDYVEEIFLKNVVNTLSPDVDGINLFKYNNHFFDDLRTLSFKDAQSNVVGNYIWCDFTQKLDMLGFGNIYPLITKLFHMYQSAIDHAFLYGNSNWYFSLTISSISGYSIYSDIRATESGVPFGDYTSWSPLISYLSGDDFSDITLWDSIKTSFTNELKKLCVSISDGQEVYETLNVYPIYAYNRCFYDYMRNVYYDTNYHVRNYNCDFIDGKSLEGSIIETEQLPLRWFHLEMHQWKKDMFTGVLPDNQLGQVSEVVIDSAHTWRSTDINGIYTHEGHHAESGALRTDELGRMVHSDDQASPIFHTHTMNLQSFADSLGFNVLALKRAEAIQQYRQDLMRAGNRTKDVFNQVFGITPKSELDESPYFIDVASQDINVNPIISTAQTGDGNNQSLGDIAARVTLSGSDLHFKFSTKDFGCLLILSYIIPDSYYNSYRIDPFNTHLDQESHGLPYFQNLGLQPIIGSMLSNYGDSQQRNRILGYAPPYIEFKTDIDLVHGDFVDAYAAAGDDAPYDPYYEGEMSPWVVARTDMQLERTVSLRNFYVNPKVLDNVFTFHAGADYSTDHFFTHSVIKVNAVRAFTEIGLPHF